MTLIDLKVGESGTIVSVAGENELVSRLHALGFVKDKSVGISRSFFGDPIIVQLGDQSIALRKQEAENIKIKKYCGVK